MCAVQGRSWVALGDPVGPPAERVELAWRLREMAERENLIMWGAENGYSWFSAGMAPLAGLEAKPLAPLWNRLGAAVFRYGEHFYNFQGLREYKEKFDPVGEPRYLAFPGTFALPRILTNTATLIGGGVRGVVAR